MLSEKNAALAVKILALCLAAALSLFVVAVKLPEAGFVQRSLESVESSSDTVMNFSAATLSASLAISALPDDFATPLADSLADMNIYFVAILVVLFLEKILLRYGIRAAFAILVPAACLLKIGFFVTNKPFFKGLAVRFLALALAVAFVVPCNTFITGVVAADLTEYVNETIEETEGGAGKLNEAMESGGEEKTVFEKLSELFQTAVSGISDLMLHFRNTIRRCINSIAILILVNCLMPLLTFVFLKWLLKELFQITLPVPPVRRRARVEAQSASGSVPELVSAGEDDHEE